MAMRVAYLRVERPGFPAADPSLTVRVEFDEAIPLSQLVDRVRRAVTHWVRSGSEAAAAVYDYAGEDLNIGDLTPHLDDPDVREYLSRQGIAALEVIEPLRIAWDYDTTLVEAIEEEQVNG